MNRFMEETRKKHSHYLNSLFTLASVLAEMGQTRSALLFYRMLIQQSNSNSKLPEYDLTALFSDIGSLYYDIVSNTLRKLSISLKNIFHQNIITSLEFVSIWQTSIKNVRSMIRQSKYR